jgi:hypothetical protein
MALVQNSVWSVSIGFRDRDKNLAAMGFYLPSALAFADAYAAAVAIATAADALSDATLESVSLNLGAYDSVAAATPAAEASDVERKGSFTFATANRQIKTRVEVPSIMNTLVVDGANVLDVDNPAVQTFITTMINTGLGANNSPVAVGGGSLTAIYGTPKKIHRGSSKG